MMTAMFAPGELFDRYRIQGVLGRGGMGTVYRAVDERLRRIVALKVLDSSMPDESRSILIREARIAAALNHPNLVLVLDVGETRGIVFLVMEHVEGVPLKEHIGKPIKQAVALQWLLDIARGLDEAHRAGLVHRDIKPTNIMVGTAGAKILDFGIAKPLDESRFTSPMMRMRTAPGSAVGTPRYMAPEQLLAGAVDARADQYAWGLLAHQLLAGTHPRGAGELTGLSALNLAAMPAALAIIVGRALAEDPNARFPSMTELIRALVPQAGTGVSTMEFRAFGPVSTPALPAAPPAPDDTVRDDDEEEEPQSSRLMTLTSAMKAFPPKSVPVEKAVEAFRPLEPTTLSAFVKVVREQLARHGAYRSAVAIITLDVDGPRARFFVQVVAVLADASMSAHASSPDALRAAGDLIAADARAGNGRWARAVLHLDAQGLGRVELT